MDVFQRICGNGEEEEEIIHFGVPEDHSVIKLSAAGKMHGDLQKSAKDSTLAHSLFAAYETE